MSVCPKIEKPVMARRFLRQKLRTSFTETCFLGSQSPGVTAEIASSHKTLLAMTEQVVFSDKHELVSYYTQAEMVFGYYYSHPKALTLTLSQVERE